MDKLKTLRHACTNPIKYLYRDVKDSSGRVVPVEEWQLPCFCKGCHEQQRGTAIKDFRGYEVLLKDLREKVKLTFPFVLSTRPRGCTPVCSFPVLR